MRTWIFASAALPFWNQAARVHAPWRVFLHPSEFRANAFPLQWIFAQLRLRFVPVRARFVSSQPARSVCLAPELAPLREFVLCELLTIKNE